MAGIRVEEKDGHPSLPLVETLQFDQADGFAVSQPSANVALINLSGVPSADEEARFLALWGPADEIGGL